MGAWFSASSLAWPLWLLIGIATGVIIGSGRRIWIVLAAIVAFYVVAIWLILPGEVAETDHWAVLTLVGAAIVASGFAIGCVLISRRSSSGSHLERPRLLTAAIVVGSIGFVAWSLYSGLIGAEDLMEPAATAKAHDCATPASEYRWPYEAINYDVADDDRLVAENPDLSDCSTQGATAGPDVVTSDGIAIAGWYIPAANGIGPGGPTLVVAHGYRSNKSRILRYAPLLHQSFNLVLVDLRNGGRSEPSPTTLGYREALDIRAIVDWIERTKEPSWIGAAGNSMGAATVLNEAVGDPRIRALILDSMHGSVTTTLADGLETEQHLPGYPTAWAMVAMTSLRMGADLTAIDPVRTITLLGDRPVLLIHGTADVLDRPEASVERTFAAAQDAGVPVTLRYCEGGRHGEVIDQCRDQWAEWANGFLGPLIHS